MPFNEKEYQKEYRSTHAKERKENQAAWYKANQTKVKAYRERNKERISRYRWFYNLKTKYGLTIDDYEELYRKQKGKCAICGTAERSRRNQRLCVDHDHKTGKIRGLLCDNCNRGIGLLKEAVFKAFQYLRENS